MEEITHNGKKGWFIHSYEKKQLDKLLKPLLNQNNVENYNETI